MDVCVFTDEVSRDFEEALDLARAAGANSVEIRGGLYGHDVTTLDEDDIERISSAVNERGMRVASIGSPIGKCSFEHLDEVQRHQELFPKMLALGERLNCRLIRCFAFWNPTGRDARSRSTMRQYLEPVARLLRPLVEQSENAGYIFGIELGAETLAGTADDVLALHKALDYNPALQVVWDIQAELSAGDNPYPNGYERLRDRIVHVHIKPNEHGTMDTLHGSPIRYDEILRRLHQDGFNGAASIEHWGSSQQMLTGVAQLRRVVDSLEPA